MIYWRYDMNHTVLIDRRLKGKIESLMEYDIEDNICYTVRFKNIDDMFWFESEVDLYNFMKEQASERFYYKELRKGHFNYINAYGETLRYYIETKRGTIILYNEDNIGFVDKCLLIRILIEYIFGLMWDIFVYRIIVEKVRNMCYGII